MESKTKAELEISTEEYRALIDKEIDAFLKRQRPYHMYKQMRYFLGFLSEKLEEKTGHSGKRFRD